MYKLGKEQRIKLDNVIKDFIGKIRMIRDCMYQQGELPNQAKVELTAYRPQLWTRRGQRAGRINRQQQEANDPND